VKSVPKTTDVVSLNPVHGEEYSIQHYVIKIVSDLRQVRGFFHGTTVSSTNRTNLIINIQQNCLQILQQKLYLGKNK
jgi:hypothetical protein